MSLLSCPTSIIFVLELTWTQNVKTVPEIKPLIIYKKIVSLKRNLSDINYEI